MAKPKRKRLSASQPIERAYVPSSMRSVTRGAFNADQRLRCALDNEANFLRSTGFGERADLLAIAAKSITLSSAERILADLQA